MIAAKAAGVAFEHKMASLNELMLGKLADQVKAARMPMFKSIGAGIQDIVVAGAGVRARDRARARHRAADRLPDSPHRQIARIQVTRDGRTSGQLSEERSAGVGAGESARRRQCGDPVLHRRPQGAERGRHPARHPQGDRVRLRRHAARLGGRRSRSTNIGQFFEWSNDEAKGKLQLIHHAMFDTLEENIEAAHIAERTAASWFCSAIRRISMPRPRRTSTTTPRRSATTPTSR